MIGAYLLGNPAAMPYYKLFSYLHKFRILMDFVKQFFQLPKRWFFPFHAMIKGNSTIKNFRRILQANG